MRFSSILRTIIRPCLINLVGVSSLQDCQDKFKCKSLVDENTSESCIVTEVLNEEQIESIMDFKARTGVYAEDLLYNYRNESPDRWLEGSFVPPNWLSVINSMKLIFFLVYIFNFKLSTICSVNIYKLILLVSKT